MNDNMALSYNFLTEKDDEYAYKEKSDMPAGFFFIKYDSFFNYS